MCDCIVVRRLDDSGRIHYSVLLMFFIIITLLSFMLLDNKIINHEKDNIDNSLTMAAFSGALCDGLKTVSGMEIVKKDVNGTVTYDFEAMYLTKGIQLKTVKVKETVEKIFLGNIAWKNAGEVMAENYSIKNVILYNLGEELEIYEWENGEESVYKIKDYGYDNYIHSPNGICIDRTSLYVCAEITILGILKHQRKVQLEKCIALKFANE